MPNTNFLLLTSLSSFGSWGELLIGLNKHLCPLPFGAKQLKWNELRKSNQYFAGKTIIFKINFTFSQPFFQVDSELVTSHLHRVAQEVAYW